MFRLSLLLSLYVSGFLGKAFAQGGGTQGSVTLYDPLNKRTFVQVTESIIKFIYDISIPLVAILVLWGGFQMITSGGSPEKFSAGKKTILYAAIGFAVVIFAGGAVALIKSLVGVN
ncbi:MAG: hypothetical protein AAB897_00710 [Patescibacteria group bacterium]